MRNRHFPRVCRHCDAPMARQAQVCWRCGTEWAPEDALPVALTVLPGGASEETRVETERWINEGGRAAREIAGASPPAAAESG